MSLKRKYLFRTVLILFFAGFLFPGCGREKKSADGESAAGSIENRPAQKTESAREPAPDFTLTKFGGGESVSLEDLRGRPVFLDFWASWCPPCRQSTPYIKKLREEFGDMVHIIGINMDRERGAAKAYIEKENIDYTQLAGAGTRTPELYNVRGIPTFYILDSEGGVVKSYSGFTGSYFNEWQTILRELLDI